MRTITCSLVVLLISAVAFAQSPDQPRSLKDSSTVEVIFDMTPRMALRTGGVSKAAMGRKAILSLVTGLPGDVPVGLTLVGGSDESGCGDVTRLVEPVPDARSTFEAALGGYKPGGKGSPLEALRRQIDWSVRNEQPTDIVIVSDFVEACSRPVCDFIARMPDPPPWIRIILVGFQKRPAHRPSIPCLLEKTNGFYFDVFNSWGLLFLIRPPSSWSNERPLSVYPFLVEAERSFMSSLNSLKPLQVPLPNNPEIQYFRLLVNGRVDIGGDWNQIGGARLMGLFRDAAGNPIGERGIFIPGSPGSANTPGDSPVSVVLMRGLEGDPDTLYERGLCCIPEGAVSLELAHDDAPIHDNVGHWKGILFSY